MIYFYYSYTLYTVVEFVCSPDKLNNSYFQFTYSVICQVFHSFGFILGVIVGTCWISFASHAAFASIFERGLYYLLVAVRIFIFFLIIFFLSLFIRCRIHCRFFILVTFIFVKWTLWLSVLFVKWTTSPFEKHVLNRIVTLRLITLV